MNARPTVPNLIQEGDREMVLLGGVIEFSIINEHTPTGYHSSRCKLISFILDSGHTLFLGNYLYRANPVTI